jgi:hypothetical protein
MSPILERIKDLYKEGLSEIDTRKVAERYKCKVKVEDNKWNKILILRFNTFILDELKNTDYRSRIKSFGLRNIDGTYGLDIHSESLGIDDENFTNYKPVIIYETIKGGWFKRNKTEIKVDMSYLNDVRVFNVMDYLSGLAWLARFKLSENDKVLIRKSIN